MVLVVKNLPASAGDKMKHGFDSWVRKIPWKRACNPLQYSCLENPMDRGGWRATIHGVAKESDTTQRLNNNSPPGITLELLGPFSKGWHPQELRSSHSERWNFLKSFKSSVTNRVCVCEYIGLVCLFQPIKRNLEPHYRPFCPCPSR